MVLFCFCAWYYVRQLASCSSYMWPVVYEIIGCGSDKGDHRYQLLDRAILLAPLARQRRRGFGNNRVSTQQPRQIFFTVNTNFTHYCLCAIVVSVDVRVVSWKTLEVGHGEQKRASELTIWSVCIMKYGLRYANSTSTLFLSVCPLRLSISTVDQFCLYESICIVDVDQFLGTMDWTDRRYRS